MYIYKYVCARVCLCVCARACARMHAHKANLDLIKKKLWIQNLCSTKWRSLACFEKFPITTILAAK